MTKIQLDNLTSSEMHTREKKVPFIIQTVVLKTLHPIIKPSAPRLAGRNSSVYTSFTKRDKDERRRSQESQVKRRLMKTRITNRPEKPYLAKIVCPKRILNNLL